jgi:hypothetical protein
VGDAGPPGGAFPTLVELLRLVGAEEGERGPLLETAAGATLCGPFVGLIGPPAARTTTFARTRRGAEDDVGLWESKLLMAAVGTEGGVRTAACVVQLKVTVYHCLLYVAAGAVLLMENVPTSARSVLRKNAVQKVQERTVQGWVRER